MPWISAAKAGLMLDDRTAHTAKTDLTDLKVFILRLYRPKIVRSVKSDVPDVLINTMRDAIIADKGITTMSTLENSFPAKIILTLTGSVTLFVSIAGGYFTLYQIVTWGGN